MVLAARMHSCCCATNCSSDTHAHMVIATPTHAPHRDGRTRASGMGPPPWARFVGELAPLEGDDKWTGFFDGFDGSV